jgi:hypothetical protein
VYLAVQDECIRHEYARQANQLGQTRGLNNDYRNEDQGREVQ